jgi:transcriptional regulator with XRE-family HTH domain
LIKRSRERLGLSVSRVAELIGRSTGMVRAWERGTVAPTESAVVSSLAAVLGIDEVTLFESAGLEPPVQRRQVTVEQALRTLTPEQAAGPPRPRAPRPGEALTEGLRVPPQERRRPPQGAPTESRQPGPVTPVTQTRPTERPVNRGAHGRSEPITGEKVGLVDRLRAATLRKPKPAAPLTTLPRAPVAPSYLEDEDERFSYKLRSVFTAAGLLVLMLGLAWAAANLFAAVGAVWEELTKNL